ncbi:hypothetical protein ACHAPQ_003066 [Fusarium lateritium]
MADVLVVYPSGKDFDLKYYTEKHMPLVTEKWTQHGLKNYTILQFQEGAPYQIQATLRWGSVDEFDKAAASEVAAEIFGDIKNFYPGDPIILKGKIVATG